MDLKARKPAPRTERPDFELSRLQHLVLPQVLNDRYKVDKKPTANNGTLKKKNRHIVIGVVSTMHGTARTNPRPTAIKATVIRRAYALSLWRMNRLMAGKQLS